MSYNNHTSAPNSNKNYNEFQMHFDGFIESMQQYLKAIPKDGAYIEYHHAMTDLTNLLRSLSQLVGEHSHQYYLPDNPHIQISGGFYTDEKLIAICIIDMIRANKEATFLQHMLGQYTHSVILNAGTIESALEFIEQSIRR